VFHHDTSWKEFLRHQKVMHGARKLGFNFLPVGDDECCAQKNLSFQFAAISAASQSFQTGSYPNWRTRQAISCRRRASANFRIAGVVTFTRRAITSERATKQSTTESCEYPERFAQESLGHQSNATHRAHAKQAQVMLPSLTEWATQQVQNIVTQEPHKHASEPTTPGKMP
jgi:hypothetical protein